MAVIEISDESAAVLRGRAQAAGMTLEAWLYTVARADPHVELPLQTAANIVLSRMSRMPPEVMAAMPKDGADQHDHYIYGTPRKEA